MRAACMMAFSSAWQMSGYFRSRLVSRASVSAMPRGSPLNPVLRTSRSGPTITQPTCVEGSLLQAAMWAARPRNRPSQSAIPSAAGWSSYTCSRCVTPTCEQLASAKQREQRGLRALQTCLPCQISRSDHSIQSPCGSSVIRSRSTASGELPCDKPSRRVSRWTCVSTTTPSAMDHTTPSTTEAVLRPTPGSVISSSRVHGTFPS